MKYRETSHKFPWTVRKNRPKLVWARGVLIEIHTHSSFDLFCGLRLAPADGGLQLTVLLRDLMAVDGAANRDMEPPRTGLRYTLNA